MTDEHRTAINELEQDLRAHDRAENSVRTIIGAARRFLEWLEAQSQSLDAVTAETVRVYRNAMREDGLKPATINLTVVALRQLFRVSMADRPNPAADLSREQEQPLAPKGAEPDEVDAILTALRRRPAGTEKEKIARIRDVAIVTLLLHTGLRVGEIAGLRSQDIERRPSRVWIIVRNAHSKGHKNRRVPLNEAARAALDRWCRIRPQDGPTVFGIGPAQIERVMRRARSTASVGKVTPHTLRHTYARRLIDSGRSLVDVAAILGHTSIATTQRYTQPTERDLEEAVDSLE